MRDVLEVTPTALLAIDSYGGAEVFIATPTEKRRGAKKHSARQGAAVQRMFLTPIEFETMLRLERRRAERSGRQFVLMLVDIIHSRGLQDKPASVEVVIATIAACTRETDVIGMYADDKTVGTILTEMGSGDLVSSLSTIQGRLDVALRAALPLRQVNDIHMSFHVYPEDRSVSATHWSADSKLYPDLVSREQDGWVSRAAKRGVDVVGSAVALAALLPVLLCIAVAIKLTSPGPVLFSQQRVGRGGGLFTFYKFRSMHAGTKASLHQAYVQQFIAGNVKAERSETTVYKISNDPRVTALGRFLRKTSLDELPQFYNVLRGEMSLVGPRPPLPYELEVYSTWHRRRLLEAKPGITGLWQVNGRSRTRFDDMVRLDLQYAGKRSLSLDIGILAKTVRTVLSGDGAY